MFDTFLENEINKRKVNEVHGLMELKNENFDVVHDRKELEKLLKESDYKQHKNQIQLVPCFGDLHATTWQVEESRSLELEEPLRCGTPSFHIVGDGQSPILKLKPLPKHLKYAYLEENKQKLVIIASFLAPEEKMSLVDVLKKRKNVIAWRITDIKSIIPSY